ncbi:hypothetical protein [Deinococcus pimensis]|uniref:hypothetical protein n=1 Tax=Deinococcus pimensis TaxID=309888 RepID=UPI000480FC00|nr:hypothetical protein [Deinococcus pimensis]
MYPKILPFLLLVVASWFGTASAQGSVGLDPSVARFSATPGTSVTQTVGIFNPTDQKVKLRVLAYLVDVDMNDVGQLSFPKAGTLPDSASRWIQVSPSEVTLEGRNRAEIRYTVTVPAGTKPGTYSSVLMFEAENPNPGSKTELARVSVRVGHGIFVNVDPITVKGEISGIFYEAPQTENGFLSLAVQYHNGGSGAAMVEGYVELRDDQGRSVAKLPLERTLSLPGRSTMLRLRWAGPAKKGQYTALVVLNDGDRDHDVVGEQLVDLPLDLAAAPPAPKAQGADGAEGAK